MKPSFNFLTENKILEISLDAVGIINQKYNIYETNFVNDDLYEHFMFIREPLLKSFTNE